MSINKSGAKATNLNGKTIAELKKMAQALNINGRPTWSEDDYRRAIVNRQKNKVVASVVNDMSSPVAEGFARIEIASTGDGMNDAPVQCLVNSFVTIIPRGVIVDVPTEIVDGSLANSTDFITKTVTDPQTGQENQVRVQVQAIPYREYSRTPGESVIQPLMKEDKLSVRNQFRALYGRWPSRLQQAEFEKELRERLGNAKLEAYIAAQKDIEKEKAKREAEEAIKRLEEMSPRKPGRPKKVDTVEASSDE